MERNTVEYELFNRIVTAIEDIRDAIQKLSDTQDALNKMQTEAYQTILARDEQFKNAMGR